MIKYRIILIVLLAIYCFDSKLVSQNDFVYTGQQKYENMLYGKAIVDLEKTVDLFPKNIDFKTKLAICYYRTNKHDIAIKYFETNEKNSLSLLYLAKVYSEKNNKNKAFYYLTKYLQQRIKYHENKIRFDKSFDNIRGDKKWKQLWNGEWYSKNEIKLFDAKYALDTKKYDLALEILNGILKKNPKKYKALYLRALVNDRTDYLKNSISDINEAIKIKPKNNDYLVLRHKLYYKANKLKKSLKDINKVIENDSLDITNYYSRAKVRYKQKNFDKALADINKVLRYKTNEDYLYLNCKINKGAKNYLDAIKSYNKLLKLNIGNENYYIERADCYVKCSTYKYAFKDYYMALDINPRNGETFYKIATLYKITGNKEKACSNIKKAKHLNYKKAFAFKIKCSETRR